MFKVNESSSQKYLNEKDKLFGLVSWKTFTSKFMAPLILGGAYSNFSDNSMTTFVGAVFLTMTIIYILEQFCSKELQYKIILLFLRPKTVSVSHRDIRQWGKYDR
jgi:hypothetical protein